MKRIDVSMLLMAGVLASACATTRPAGGPAANVSGRPAEARGAAKAEAALQARVTAFWTLRQAKDLAGMYELYSPAYRAQHSKPEFLLLTRLIRFPILEYHVAKIAIDETGKRATVTVGYKSSAPQVPDPFDSEVTDGWVLAPDGRWYKEQDETILPFPKVPGEAVR